MPNLKSLIRDLAKHAVSKKGAQQDSSWCNFDVLEEPHVELSGSGSWMGFFEIDIDDAQPFAQMPVLKESLQRHRKQYPVIRESSMLE